MFNKLVSARNSKKGFTLIELMVVVAIIAILAAIAIPGYAAYKKSAKIGVVRNAINSMIDMVNASEATDQLKMTLTDKTLAEVAANYSAEYDHVDMTAEFLDVAGKQTGSNFYTLTATDDELFALYVD